MECVLETNNLYKKYKNDTALNGLTMHVPDGSIYGLVGKNGSGKTTLIRLICGLQRPTFGHYYLYGTKNTEKQIYKARQRMAAIVEMPALYKNMSAEDNLKQQYILLGKSAFNEIPDLLRLVGLENAGKKKVKNYSLGMKQRLGIALALVGKPDFLILDEPINGLDPQGIVEIRELLMKLNTEQHITIMISSHILDELSRLATHYGIIDSGQIIKELSTEELSAECKKYVRIKVSDMNILKTVLENRKIEYKEISTSEVDAIGDVNVSDLIISLAKQNCEVLSVSSKEESLTDYYLSLVEGRTR